MVIERGCQNRGLDLGQVKLRLWAKNDTLFTTGTEYSKLSLRPAIYGNQPQSMRHPARGAVRAGYSLSMRWKLMHGVNGHKQVKDDRSKCSVVEWEVGWSTPYCIM